MRAVFWFRNDLRLHDNEALLQASRAHELTCIYVVNHQWIKPTNWGCTRMAYHKYFFLYQGLVELQQRINSIGGKLLVKFGDPVEEIKELCTKVKATHIFYQEAAGFEEENQVKQLLAFTPHLIHNSFEGQTLVHKQQLPFLVMEIPKIFTEFRKQVEQKVSILPVVSEVKRLPASPILEESKVPEPHELNLFRPSHQNYGNLTFTGGEKAGLARLYDYTWKTQHLKNYKETRNGLLGMNYSSKFSPWLAWGFLSPRKVYWEVKQFESEVVKNASTYWLVFELLWRDFFNFTISKHGNKPFLKGGLRQVSHSSKFNFHVFKQWVDGKTGEPFIDANMKELRATGFMSNRGRQNVASYLVHNLKQDWRAGATYFEEQLIDYDVSSNWGNWNYVAGVGNDPRENRVFNPKVQSARYDPQDNYIKTWLGN